MMGRKPNQGGAPPDREADKTADGVASTAQPVAAPKPKSGEARKARLAAALRANLQRRKTQMRGRDAADPPPQPDSSKPDDEREP